jgi:DNA replication protein DnaT
VAVPWIKIEHTTPDKPEIDAIADLLGIDPDHVFGILVRLWIWADQQTEKGNARSVTKKAIDRRAKVNDFADAMIAVGWLTCDSAGLTFINFEKHNGQTAKQRAVTAKRVSKHKSGINGEGNAHSVT